VCEGNGSCQRSTQIFLQFDGHIWQLSSYQEAPGCVSLTVDCWASESMELYITVTDHYVTKSRTWRKNYCPSRFCMEGIPERFWQIK
jgi:hypothetical protein